MWNKECLFVSPHIWLFLFISQGSKAMDYSNGLFDCQSPTSPFLGGLRVLHLLEDLRGALELMDNEERDNLRCQIPDSTAEGLAEWLHGRLVKMFFLCLVLVVCVYFLCILCFLFTVVVCSNSLHSLGSVHIFHTWGAVTYDWSISLWWHLHLSFQLSCDTWNPDVI